MTRDTLCAGLRSFLSARVVRGAVAGAVGVGAAALVACTPPAGRSATPRPDTASTAGAEGGPKRGLRMNEIQAVGSHNSYKRAIPAVELALLRERSPEGALALDYGHVSLTEQLERGLRQLELDVYRDPVGGRYADPLLPRLASGLPGAEPYDPREMDAPGYKVMHLQDVDVRTSCKSFVACLREIRAWSDANPRHVPILILINAKDAPIDQPGAVAPLPFDAAAFDALDGELLSGFERSRIVAPDDVRRDAATLRDGATTDGWPLLDDARGKLVFTLDEDPAIVEIYARGRGSLEGLPMFVNAVSERADHAAYVTLNDPVGGAQRIRDAVRAGLLVRTRADADTREARTGDTRRRDAALASGAQYVSTDYYLPRADLGPYRVALPDGTTERCNPILHDTSCTLSESSSAAPRAIRSRGAPGEP